MTIAVSVKGLSKRYTLHHEARARDDSLREVIADGTRSAMRRVLSGRSSHTEKALDEEFWALKDVSFEVKQGERLGIIGRNGAGKSTLLKILSRITEPTGGRIEIRGRVSSLLEVGTGFHPELTGRENIYLNGAILGMGSDVIRRKFDEIVAFAEIERFLDTPVKRYSSGMYVRLAFAVAAHLEPEILIVDEVLAVGDVAFQRKCLGRMEDVATKEGRTILFVSHQMAAVQNLCHRAILLDGGKIVSEGDTRVVTGAYLRDSTALSTISWADRADRQGTGDIRFTAMVLKTGSGEVVTSFRSGETAVLSVAFTRARIESLRDLHVAIGIDGELGDRITVLSSEISGTAFDEFPRSAKGVEVRIDKLPLMPGRYGFTLFSTVNGVVADWIQNAGFFDVRVGDYYQSGKLLPAGQGNFFVDCAFSPAR